MSICGKLGISEKEIQDIADREEGNSTREQRQLLRKDVDDLLDA